MTVEGEPGGAHAGAGPVIVGIIANTLLSVLKIISGVLGSSEALIADGIESTADIFSSLITLGGLRISVRGPDDSHPYGHGRAEPLAALSISIILAAAGLAIAVRAAGQLAEPHEGPAPFTLIVLVAVFAIKESLFRYQARIADALGSTALRSEAWHHRADMFTSLFAFIGISIALIGGERFEMADDLAALIAAGVVLYNAARLLMGAMDEIMDKAWPEVESEAIREASRSEGVVSVHGVRARKSGLKYFIEMHLVVDESITVREGHKIAHGVKRRIMDRDGRIMDLIVHIEPGSALTSYPPLPS